MQRATTTARRPLSSSNSSTPSTTAARRISQRSLSSQQSHALARAAPRRQRSGLAASVAVSASAEERQTSSTSSPSTSSSSSSSSSSTSPSAAEIAVLSSSKSPLALAAVGALGAASTTPFGSALFASIVGGGNGGGWWKGGGGNGGGGGGGDGSGGSGGNGKGNNDSGKNNFNPSVSDVAAKADDDDDDEEDDDGEEEEEEEADDASAAAGKASASSASSAAAAAAAAADEDDDEEDDDDEDDEEEDEGATKKNKKKKRSSAVSSSSSEQPVNTFYVSKVVAHGLPTGLGVPTEDELFEGGACQPGLPASRVDVANDLSRLVGTGMFGNVDAKVTQAPGKKKGECVVEFTFHEKQWPALKSFRVVSTSSKQGPAIPYSEVAKVMEVASGETGIRRLAAIRSIVDGWYQRHGYAPHCHIVRFDGLGSGDVTAVVAEPRVERVRVTPIDDYGQPLPASAAIVKPHVVLRELPFRRGEPYNQGVDARKALRNVYATGCFDDVQIVPNPLDHEGDKLEVIVFVRERPAKTVDLDLEWQVAPDDAGKPGLVTPFPGGSITYEDRNVRGVGATASASLTSANLLSPGDDLGFRVEGKWPYFRGPRDPRRGALTLAAFNGRKVSPVFAGGPGAAGDDVPPVFVDRVGAKVALQETYSRNSHGSVGLVVEQVTARDEAGALAPRGTKQLATGALAPLGPPTTLSDSGRDVVAYLQGALVRDATWDCGGQTVGPRDSATVEQGVFLGSGGGGGGGSPLPVFNRATLSVTRHLRLPPSLLGGKVPLQLPERLAPRPSLAGPRPPASLVLHARGGAAVGPLPSYEAFSLGGPHSARGYNTGELSTARRFLEAAAELRVPVAKATAFAFVEGAHDLGSSSEVTGNPSAFYRRPGAGTSMGVGAKMGAMRLEYATDNNAGRGAVFMRYGERF